MPGLPDGSGHDVVVVGASAGGIEALKELVGALPKDLPAALFVVLHLPSGGISTLPAILDRAGELPAFHVLAEGSEISPGTIYVAPPDFHVQLVDGRVEAIAGPRENGHRPAIAPNRPERLLTVRGAGYKLRAVWANPKKTRSHRLPS